MTRDSHQVRLCRSDSLVTLTRVVRMGAVRQADLHATHGRVQETGTYANGLGGVPTPVGLGAVYDLEITVRGRADTRTGYVIGIQDLDRAMRRSLVPRLQSAYAANAPATPSRILAESAPEVQAELPEGIEFIALSWQPSPFMRVDWRTTMPDTAIICQRFEFAAAHRLHCDDLTEADNKRIFGKCNNPNGHGHNYRIEVGVRVPVSGSHPAMTTVQLEAIVGRTVIDRYDHKHLNLDVEEFRAVVPSVENIARACHALLMQPVTDGGAQLNHVRVWETDKTSATYPAAAG